MKETVGRIAIATTLGLGAWFGHNFEPHKPYNNQSTLVSTQENSNIRRSSTGESALDLRTPEIVLRVNAAIAVLEACSDPMTKEAAKSFLSINKQAKIAFAYGDEIGMNSIGVVLLPMGNKNVDVQIGINPKNLLDPNLPDKEVAIQMLKAVVTFNIVKDSPEKFDQDSQFKDTVTRNADLLAKEALCAK